MAVCAAARAAATSVRPLSNRAARNSAITEILNRSQGRTNSGSKQTVRLQEQHTGHGHQGCDPKAYRVTGVIEDFSVRRVWMAVATHWRLGLVKRIHTTNSIGNIVYLHYWRGSLRAKVMVKGLNGDNLRVECRCAR
jgi:hypothetical protein